MALRAFIFCDVCNPKGIRSIEERRARRDGTSGQRNSDGRAWFDGTLNEAEQHGWQVLGDGRHVCQRCYARGLHEK